MTSQVPGISVIGKRNRWLAQRARVWLVRTDLQASHMSLYIPIQSPSTSSTRTRTHPPIRLHIYTPKMGMRSHTDYYVCSLMGEWETDSSTVCLGLILLTYTSTSYMYSMTLFHSTHTRTSHRLFPAFVFARSRGNVQLIEHEYLTIR